jgi:ABC-type transport system substrate-binding protein
MDYLSERLYTSPSGQRGRLNLSYVNNPQLNQLLEKQRSQFNETERKATVREIETICAEEQYEIYYSTSTYGYFWDPDIENYRPRSFFPYVFPVRAWRER